MIKNVKKGIVVASIIAILGGSTAASAANNFRFSMVSNVIGKKEFNLKNKTNGVKNASVNFMLQKMTVEFEDGEKPEDIMPNVLKNCKKVEDDCEIFF